MYIHLTELNLAFDWAVLKHTFCRIWKWTFGLLWGLWWKRKYLHIKNRQKHCDKLLCDVCIQLTELNLSFDWATLKHSICRISQWIFAVAWGLWRKRKYLHITTRQQHSDKLFCDVCIRITELNLTFHWGIFKYSFCRICKMTFGALQGLWWITKRLHVITRQKHYEKLQCDVCFRITQSFTFLLIEQLWNILFVESESGYLELLEAYGG